MKMKMEPMRLAELLSMRHEKNPKAHDINALISSFRRFGFTAAPTIDEKTHVLVAGHGRCEALQRLKDGGFEPPAGVELDAKNGEWMVPVVRGVSFRTDAERDAYVIADNQHVIAGGWDMDKLTEMLRAVGDDAGFDGVGFDAADLRALGLADEDLDDADDDDPSKVREHDRKKKKNGQGNTPRGGELQYRIVIACKDEKHQAELLGELEERGLDVKPLIV